MTTTTTTESWVAWLREREACIEAIRWVSGQTTPERAWASCARGDWMLWALGHIHHATDARRSLVLAACECARLALPHVLPGEDRPRLAIETAERWARGEDVTLKGVRAASRDVFRAAHDAATAENAIAHAAAGTAWAASATAWAAATAAGTAWAATAYATASAASAAASHVAAATAWAATATAAHCSSAAAGEKVLRECADIVRRYFSDVPLSI